MFLLSDKNIAVTNLVDKISGVFFIFLGVIIILITINRLLKKK